MKSLLKKNQIVSVIPEDVRGAGTGIITKSAKKAVEIEIAPDNLQFYEKDGIVELFASADDGMLYFSSTLKDIDGNILKIAVPENFDILQRREFTRISMEKKVNLKIDKEDKITCKCLDISAGGMKLEADKQLDMEQDYTVSFSLENNVNISCYLRPIRISKSDNGKYIVSGRFVLLKNIDKIAIVQFCFKKEIENTNK